MKKVKEENQEDLLHSVKEEVLEKEEGETLRVKLTKAIICVTTDTDSKDQKQSKNEGQ